MYSPNWASTMFRYTSDRYHRSNGLKVKHFLQIAMITVVVTWVIYQLNQSQKPDEKALEKDSPFGRKALKPGLDLMDSEDREKEEPADNKVNARNSKKTDQGHSAAEGEDESDDQREFDTSVENASNDPDQQHEDEGQQQEDMNLHNDVGIDFAELKNEQERLEREESAGDGKDNEQDEDPQSQSNLRAEDNTGAEVTLGIDNHLESNEDEDATGEESKRSSTLDTLAADSLPKPNSDVAIGNGSEVTEDEKREVNPGSSSEPQKERGWESLAEVVEEGNATHEPQEQSQEKTNSQPQEQSEKKVQILEEKSDSLSQAKVNEGTPKSQEFTDKQSPGQSEVSGKNTEEELDSRIQKQAEVEQEKSEKKPVEQSQNQADLNVGGKESQRSDEVKLSDTKVEQESKKGVFQEPEKQVLEEKSILQQGEDPQVKEEKVEKGETQEGDVAQGKVEEKLGTQPQQYQEKASDNDNNKSEETKKEPESNSEVQSSETTVLTNSSSEQSGSLQHSKTEDLTDATASSPDKDYTKVVESTAGQNKLNKDSGNIPQTEGTVPERLLL